MTFHLRNVLYDMLLIGLLASMYTFAQAAKA